MQTTLETLGQLERRLNMAVPIADIEGEVSKRLARLTARELEVLGSLATGASTAEIASRLRISPKTLRNHISNTYHKLGIFDRAQAVIIAVREGLVQPS